MTLIWSLCLSFHRKRLNSTEAGYERTSAPLPVGKPVWHQHFILTLLRHSLVLWSTSLHNILQHHLQIWKPILTSKFIYVCPPFHKIYICLLLLKIYKCLNILPLPHILARISLRSVKLNQFDQVSALCTAWRWWMRQGRWWWRSDWPTAGASVARVVKVRGQGGERACGRWSILAQLCLSASSEPICLCWTCNAVSAPAYYLSP